MSTSVWRGYPSKTYPYGPGAFAIISGKGPDKTCNNFERIFRDIKCIYMLVEFYNPTFSISPTHFDRKWGENLFECILFTTNHLFLPNSF